MTSTPPFITQKNEMNIKKKAFTHSHENNKKKIQHKHTHLCICMYHCINREIIRNLYRWEWGNKTENGYVNNNILSL